MENKVIEGCVQSSGDKQLIYDNLDEWLNDEGKIVCYLMSLCLDSSDSLQFRLTDEVTLPLGRLPAPA